ncbi:hypothetical protein BJV82DRAFT_605478 [Fennellomyces sp. T-0311]|nr:hypothetical protein BJV82DRAFT_605478 [Fennellomyces sp. T-0311]
MPVGTTLFALGAAGIAGAAAYKHNKKKDDRSNDMTPFAMGRRTSGGMQNDLFAAQNQAENFWRRDYGVNFSHNADRCFPIDSRKES